MIILDTNVVSELMRPEPASQVADWVRRRDRRELRMTSITLARIRFGIARLPAGRRKQALLDTADDTFRAFDEQILPVDAAAAEEYAIIASARELGSRSLVSTLLSPPSAAPAARYLPLATCPTSMAPASRSLTLGRPQAADRRRPPPSGTGTCSAGSARPGPTRRADGNLASSTAVLDAPPSAQIRRQAAGAHRAGEPGGSFRPAAGWLVPRLREAGREGRLRR